jgi:hypothetical protein
MALTVSQPVPRKTKAFSFVTRDIVQCPYQREAVGKHCLPIFILQGEAEKYLYNDSNILVHSWGNAKHIHFAFAISRRRWKLG